MLATLRHRDFALLWVAGFISVAGVLLGSLAGVFVDRWDRKRTLVVADLARAALLLPLLAVVSSDLLWLLYAVRAGTGVVGLFFYGVPKVVPEQKRREAAEIVTQLP